MRLSDATLVCGVLALAAAPGASCSEASATRVYIRTDAPLGTPRLFHRALIEVRRSGVLCAECARDFAVDAKSFPNGVASFELVGTGEAAVRVRLVRDRGGLAPRPASTIEIAASVPLDGGTYVLDAPMVNVARPSTQTARAITGSPAALPASLPDYLTTCAGAPRDDQVCIPGGHFWMGDPKLEFKTAGDDVDGSLERLVTLDAFYMDKTEVTVGALRRSGLATPTKIVPAGTKECTYPAKADDATADTLPANCMVYSLARDYCARNGGTLPTEAEFEYVAGGLRSSSFVWGDDALRCGDAAVYMAACPVEKPVVVATTARDTFEVRPGEKLFDIVGNVHEYTADYWNPETGPCWGTGHFKNPLCATPDAKHPEARSMRGGAYIDLVTYAPAALREYGDHAETRVGTSAGFRCVRR